MTQSKGSKNCCSSSIFYSTSSHLKVWDVAKILQDNQSEIPIWTVSTKLSARTLWSKGCMLDKELHEMLSQHPMWWPHVHTVALLQVWSSSTRNKSCVLKPYQCSEHLFCVLVHFQYIYFQSWHLQCTHTADRREQRSATHSLLLLLSHQSNCAL